MLFSTLAIASLSSITLASPLTSGSPASSALGRLAKRTPWNLDSKLDTKIQAALTTGLKDAISIAATVLDANNGLKNKAKNDQYLIDYFGTNDDQTYDQVRRVFENLVGTNPDGTGSSIPANVYVDSNDWLIPDVGKGPGGGGDGKKHLCDFANEGGQSLTAYTALHPSSKSKWGMHFCPKWETRVENGYSLDRLVANNCEALKDTTVMDTTLMGRQNYAFAILHEFFHVREVARDVTAKYVRDWAYGAWDVLQLALGRVKKPGRVGVAEPFENADTFTWYAMHLYLNANCGGKVFAKASSVDNSLEFIDTDPIELPEQYTVDDGGNNATTLVYGPENTCQDRIPNGDCINVPGGCWIMLEAYWEMPRPKCNQKM